MDDLDTLAVILPSTMNTAVKHGVDIQAILNKFGVSVDLQNITQSMINLRVLHAIVSEVETKSNIPAIGLQTGKDFDFDFLPYFRTCLVSAPTVRDIFLICMQLKKLLSPILNFTLKESENDAKMALRPDADLSVEDDRLYTEMIFSTLVSQVRKLSKGNYVPTSVSFQHNQTHLLSVYEDFFNCPVLLNQPENQLIYDRHIIDKPLPGGIVEVHMQAKQILEHQIRESPLQKGIGKQITRAMTNQKELLNESIETVAGYLHMSSRTLQRRIAEEGLTLVELKDNLKFKLAKCALKDKDQNIEEISEDLGFSDRHSFTRAFKRWSGMTPTAFRKQKLRKHSE